MPDERVLMRKATEVFVSVFGRKYLQDNYLNTCKAYGMIDERTFQLFLGIKGSQDLPDRKANSKGLVVYGLVLLDAITGEPKALEYVKE